MKLNTRDYVTQIPMSRKIGEIYQYPSSIFSETFSIFLNLTSDHLFYSTKAARKSTTLFQGIKKWNIFTQSLSRF